MFKILITTIILMLGILVPHLCFSNNKYSIDVRDNSRIENEIIIEIITDEQTVTYYEKKPATDEEISQLVQRVIRDYKLKYAKKKE